MYLIFLSEKGTLLKNIQNLGSWDNSAFCKLRFLSMEGVSMQKGDVLRDRNPLTPWFLCL